MNITYNSDVYYHLLKGVNALADAVKVTLGPKGQFVIINEQGNKLKVTKDGVSVAKSITLSNPLDNIGVNLVKEAAVKTLNTVGDATTTSVVLTQALVNSGISAIEIGRDPIKLVKGIKRGLTLAKDFINANKRSVEDNDIKNIATISANNDPEIGNIIYEAFSKIGRDGIITVENSTNSTTSVEIINGMQFDRGYVADHFVTDYTKDVCVLENPYILITDHKVNRMKDIAFILNNVISEGRSILIIAEDFDNEVLETLKVNKLDNRLKVCPVKAPSFGEYRSGVLEDIACLTGATVISYNSHLELQDTTMAMLGTCNKVKITKNDTLIINENVDSERVSTRVERLKTELKEVKANPSLDGSFMIKFLSERIAKLTGGLAVIYVGGVTESEMSERKDRIDDAVSATKAAIESGIVLGGGLTYYNASKYLESFENNDRDIDYGIRIVEQALLVPFNTIVTNAGYNKPKRLYKMLTDSIGFDADKERFVNMYESGIIDPAKSAQLALENSISVTCLILLTKCLVTPEQFQIV